MPIQVKRLGASLFALALGFSAPAVAHAEDGAKPWWPIKVQDVNGDKAEIVDYVPLEHAAKKWHLCVLFPHLKDSVWVAFNYGVIQEAKRLGVQVTLFEAGGYTELNKQLSQYDDCMALKPDAILFAAISEAGMINKVKEGKQKGIAQISIVNTVSDAVPYDAQVYGDYAKMAESTARYLLDKYKDTKKELSVVTFPGPQGAGWAESAAKAMRDTLAGSKLKIVAEKFGDTGKTVQLSLVEDALQAFPNVDILLLNAVSAEVAPAAVQDHAMSHPVDLVSWYINDGSLRNIKSGDVEAAAMQISVPMASIGVDQAVRVLEKKKVIRRVAMVPQMITKKNISDDRLKVEFAPADWRPVFNVQ
jgi:periplasmic protein TorT